jgi:Protein of unknown function (DUF3375)
VIDYDALEHLRQNHAAWRLLGADHAAVVLAFCDAVFVRPNRRGMPGAELVAALDGFLAELRERHGADRYPKSARQYLDDWAGPERGFLRKYYPASGAEAAFDLTPATEKALEWVKSLLPPPFVGTESRLLALFDMLRDLSIGGEIDPRARIVDLERRRDEIEREIERVKTGQSGPMDATRIRERYVQIEEAARRLLGDFRQVEENFRRLDEQTRERIATSTQKKGALLDELFGETDHIRQSDQGKSFDAFWAFLMSGARQEELHAWLDNIHALPTVQALVGDDRERGEGVRRFPFALLDAGEQAHQTVARLVEQLRRYLDEQAHLENRRIVELARTIETHAIKLKASLPAAAHFTDIDALVPEIDVPMGRTLYLPTRRPVIDAAAIAEGEADLDLEALFAQSHIDEGKLREHIAAMLRGRPQITLAEVTERFPPEQGLAELVGYFRIAATDLRATVDEKIMETVVLPERGSHRPRSVRVPRVIFTA